MKRIVLEAEADDIATLYRALKHAAELVKHGETENVVNDGIYGTREFHVYDVD